MKRNFFLLFLLCYNFIYSQNSDVYTARQVTKMVVFPGCEKFTTNTDLQKCFTEKLTKQLSKDLDPQIDFFLGLRTTGFVAKIEFVVNKQGELIEIKNIAGGNSQFGNKAVESLVNYSKRLTIQPAILENNEPVNLIFQLPIKYNFSNLWNKEISIFEESNTQELVYLTIHENNETYEIRLKRDLTFSIYQVEDGKDEFLGNVSNWLEFTNMEPFAQYVNRYINEQQWELVTEGELDGEEFRIYRWSYDLEYVRVYKIVNGEEELVLKSNRFSKFKKSPYLKLLFRQ